MNIFYRIARMIVRVVLFPFLPLKIIDKANIPRKGPVVLACNHLHWSDPIQLSLACKRPVYYMAKEQVFKNKIAGFFLRRLGAFPVDRDGADLSAIKRALTLLREGKVLGIFPEGTRNKSSEPILPFNPGAAMLAIKGKAALVPVRMMKPARLFHRNTIVVGEPMMFEAYRSEKLTQEVLERATHEIECKMIDLAGKTEKNANS